MPNKKYIFETDSRLLEEADRAAHGELLGINTDALCEAEILLRYLHTRNDLAVTLRTMPFQKGQPGYAAAQKLRSSDEGLTRITMQPITFAEVPLQQQ